VSAESIHTSQIGFSAEDFPITFSIVDKETDIVLWTQTLQEPGLVTLHSEISLLIETGSYYTRIETVRDTWTSDDGLDA